MKQGRNGGGKNLSAKKKFVMHNNAYSSPGRCFPFCPIFFFVCIYFSFTPTQDGWLKGVFVKTRQAPAALNRVGGKLNNGMADYRAGKLAAYVTQLDGFFFVCRCKEEASPFKVAAEGSH